jgi:hypothetical protein
MAVGLAACTTTPLETSIQRLVDANKLAADLLVQFSKAGDAAMTRIEGRMTTAAAVARDQLTMLAGATARASRPRLSAASASLDRFLDLNAQLIALSRRNTNVRSLALSLGQKRMRTAACEDSLHALRDALAMRGFSATR